jgi:AraC family transcriptional regulator
MNRSSTAASYERRLRRVTEHIWTHLDEPLDLAALADIACFSPYHFHRTYRAMLGETVAETVARLRLQRAAHQLQRTPMAIADISRAAGYASPAAFTRAFRLAYGRTPAAFRVSRRHVDPDTPGSAVEVQDRAPLRIACVRHHGPPNEIGRAFDRLLTWAGPRGFTSPPTLGVAVYLSDMTVTPPADQLALAGITVGPEVQADDTVEIHEVPGGRHAVIVHRGPFAKLGQSYDALFAWLPASGEEAANRPIIEINCNNPHGTRPPDLITEICLPLK